MKIKDTVTFYWTWFILLDGTWHLANDNGWEYESACGPRIHPSWARTRREKSLGKNALGRMCDKCASVAKALGFGSSGTTSSGRSPGQRVAVCKAG